MGKCRSHSENPRVIGSIPILATTFSQEIRQSQNFGKIFGAFREWRENGWKGFQGRKQTERSG